MKAQELEEMIARIQVLVGTRQRSEGLCRLASVRSTICPWSGPQDYREHALTRLLAGADYSRLMRDLLSPLQAAGLRDEDGNNPAFGLGNCLVCGGAAPLRHGECPDCCH